MRFKVTMISEGCTIITWKRSDLLRALRREPQLKNVFNSIIGQDVALKLFKSNKAINFHMDRDVDDTMHITQRKYDEPPLHSPCKNYFFFIFPASRFDDSSSFSINMISDLTI